MPTFQHDASDSLAMNGTYDHSGGIVIIPSGETVQAFAATEGSLVWIEPSGKLAIYEASSGWVTTTFATLPSQGPDAAAVSGELRIWLNNTDYNLDVPSTPSGVDQWNNKSQHDTEDFLETSDSSPMNVASGGINGLDAMYFRVDQSEYWRNQAPGDVLTPFNGSNKPLTAILVFRPDITAGQTVFGFGKVGEQFESNWLCGVDGNGQFQYFRRNNTNTGSVNITPAGYTPGEVICVSYVDNGTTMRIYKNKVEVTADASGTNVGDMGCTRAAVGCNYRGTPDSFMAGFVCEVAVYSSGMDDTNRELVEQGLMDKWGIS